MMPIDQHTDEVIAHACSLERCAELMTLHRSVFRRLSKYIWEHIRHFLLHLVEGTLSISRTQDLFQGQRNNALRASTKKTAKDLPIFENLRMSTRAVKRGYFRSSLLDTSILVGPGIFFKERNQRATENLGVHLSRTAGCLDSPVIGAVA